MVRNVFTLILSFIGFLSFAALGLGGFSGTVCVLLGLVPRDQFVLALPMLLAGLVGGTICFILFLNAYKASRNIAKRLMVGSAFLAILAVGFYGVMNSPGADLIGKGVLWLFVAVGIFGMLIAAFGKMDEPVAPAA